MLLTDGGDNPDPDPVLVLLGVGGDGALVVCATDDAEDAVWVFTGPAAAVVVWTSLAVVAVLEATALDTEVGPAAVPPPQFAGFVARPGPA